MLRPLDIAVLLKLTLPRAAELSFQKLASDLHVASSEVHGSIKRAQVSGLIQHDGSKRVNRSGLLVSGCTGRADAGGANLVRG